MKTQTPFYVKKQWLIVCCVENIEEGIVCYPIKESIYKYFREHMEKRFLKGFLNKGKPKKFFQTIILSLKDKGFVQASKKLEILIHILSSNYLLVNQNSQHFFLNYDRNIKIEIFVLLYSKLV